MTNPVEASQVAAVDLGSNSFHMVIARVAHGHLHVIDRMRERVQLARGLDETGALSPEAEARAVACLERFGQRLRDMRPEHVRAVGTNAFRRAKNRRAFLRKAESLLGHGIDVLPGREEARILFRGVAHDLPVIEGSRLVVDIGGSSTECILGTGEEAQRTDSLQMGCVSFTERFFPDGKITRDRFKRASVATRLELEPVQHYYRRSAFAEAVGSSGTILAIDGMARLAASGPSKGITHAAIKSLREQALAQGSIERLDLPGLSPDRRSVIVGGLAILHGVFKSLEIETMQASRSALREGLLLELVGRLGDEDVRERTVRRLCERYLVDPAQGRRVEATALDMARQVGALYGFTPRSFRLLRWAAWLHEIGQALSFSRYHRHGAYLLLNSDLPGFSEQGQAYLAALVSAHRRSLAEDKLSNLRQIDGERAVRLALLLRLSMRLNRARSAEPMMAPIVRVLDHRIELEWPAGFLDAHPMTRADLDEERELLAAAGIDLGYR